MSGSVRIRDSRALQYAPELKDTIISTAHAIEEKQYDGVKENIVQLSVLERSFMALFSKPSVLQKGAKARENGDIEMQDAVASSSGDVGVTVNPLSKTQ